MKSPVGGIRGFTPWQDIKSEERRGNSKKDKLAQHQRAVATTAYIE